MRTFVVSLALAFVMIGSGTASAQAPGMVADSPTSTDTGEVTERYGLQILAADVLNLALMLAHENNELFLGGLLLPSPTIHLVHGNGGGAMASLALRALLPLGGGLAGAKLAESNCHGSDEFLCGLGEVVLGIFLGGATAMLIDYYHLAKKTRREPRANSLIRVGSLRVNPELGVGKQGSMRFGLRGSW